MARGADNMGESPGFSFKEQRRGEGKEGSEGEKVFPFWEGHPQGDVGGVENKTPMQGEKEGRWMRVGGGTPKSTSGNRGFKVK